MWWTNPFWLLALVLVIPIIRLGNLSLPFHRGLAVTGDGPRSEQDRNLIWLTTFRILTIVVIVLALAGTKVWLPSSHRQMVILIDTSASIPVSRIEEARTTALSLIGQLKPKDQVAVASFAGTPQLIIPFSTRDTVVSELLEAELHAPKPETTNLQAALLLGKELLAETQGNRSILIFSDGRSSTGGSINPVLQSMRGIPINVVPVGRTGGGLFSQGLELPENIHPDEPVLGYWKLVTDQAQTLPVTVKINDRTVLKKKIAVASGMNSIPLDLPGQNFGIYQVTVEVDAVQDGSFPEANTGAILKIKGKARVMIASGNAVLSPVGKALQTQGIDVEYGGIEDLPESLLGLTGYGAIVLDNVPALYLTETQQETIQNYVAGGGGLLVIGGDSSLGRGEYYATGLEDLLPVQTDTRQRLLFTRANILFVIDRSGSMSEKVGGVSKQLAAMQGVLGAVKELNPIDEVGILAFDTQPTWVLPFTPVSQAEIIRNSIREIGPGGGTDISTALEEIVTGFRERGPVRRHTVIITDGLTALDSDYQKLIDRLKTAGITVTTIGIGEEINEELLRNFAKWGEGQFYRADLDQIPKVILKETVRVTRDLIQEGSFRPKVRTYAQVIKGLNQDSLPPVNGYLITKPKKLATVHLETGKEDPLLASWRFGSGQVAVFTSDSGGRWLKAWSGTSYYNRLWSQLIRTIERGSTDTGLQVHTGIESGNALIEVEAIGPDRRLRTGLQLIGSSEQTGETFILNETAPGHYQSSVALKGAGLHTFQIREQFGGEPAIGWVWNNQGGESQIFGPDLMFLGQLATVSGGKIFNQVSPTLPKTGWAWKQVALENYLIILALLLLVIELGYRSASLGQMRMAQALLDAWWAAQNRLVDMMRGFTFRDSSGDYQKVNEAYRYLAEQARRKKEGGEKDA
jgi:Ca-activated chloride channel family protein